MPSHNASTFGHHFNVSRHIYFSFHWLSGCCSVLSLYKWDMQLSNLPLRMTLPLKQADLKVPTCLLRCHPQMRNKRCSLFRLSWKEMLPRKHRVHMHRVHIFLQSAYSRSFSHSHYDQSARGKFSLVVTPDHSLMSGWRLPVQFLFKQKLNVSISSVPLNHPSGTNRVSLNCLKLVLIGSCGCCSWEERLYQYYPGISRVVKKKSNSV